MASAAYEKIASPEWLYEPLVVNVYGKSQTIPSVRLQLVPVFFNPRKFCQNL